MPRRIDLRELDLYLRACEVDLVEFVASGQQAVQESKVVVGIEVKLKKGRPVVSPSEGLTNSDKLQAGHRIPD